MDRRSYEEAICARLSEGQIIPFREVSLGEWRPAISACHENVNMWVRSNPQCVAVRGWVTYASFGAGTVGLTAHSIVQDPNGNLFDITPQNDESIRQGMRFIAHVGDDPSFFETKANGHSFVCPPDLLSEIMQQGWSPTGDGDME